MKIEIPAFESVRILVIGDVMLDRYWHGGTDRISPEAPVPVVSIKGVHERPGGAGNVAINVNALGSKVSLLSLVGQDTAADSLETSLKSTGIDCHFQRVPGLPTITKLRVIDKNQQLIRLDFEQRFQADHASQLFAAYREQLAHVQAVILSDYGKGTLASIQELIAAARERNVPVLIDPKSKDFSIYHGASIITPNLKEFEAVVGHCHNEVELEAKGRALMRAHQLGALLITRGEHGMTLLQDHAPALHLPARAREVYDVTGAGDTVISVFAAAYAAGEDLATAAMLANTAAGITVQKLGAASVSVSELRRALQRHHNSEMGMLTEEELMITLADAREHGESIVMTNGCFDILHAGHVAYLEQAKALGKRLVVAVNDDASVARLKGDERPINSLEDRMAVLAALRAVDWVVPFSEDTPTRLISRILPDVLVKGGDYKSIENLAGAKEVLANGGQVKILDLVPGRSTTNIVRKIQEELV